MSPSSFQDSFGSTRVYITFTIGYILLWVGFLIWAFMGSYWATVSIRNVAYTYFGFHYVCDVYYPDGEDTSAAAYDTMGLFRDFFIDVGPLYTETVGNTTLLSDSEELSMCYKTEHYVQPVSNLYHNKLLLAWCTLATLSSAWTIFIAIANVIFCCAYTIDKARKRVMILLGISSGAVVLHQIASILCFTNGLHHYMYHHYSTDQAPDQENSTATDQLTTHQALFTELFSPQQNSKIQQQHQSSANDFTDELIDGVSYQLEISFYLNIAIASIFAVGSGLCWLSVVFMELDRRAANARRQRTMRRVRQIEMRTFSSNADQNSES